MVSFVVSEIARVGETVYVYKDVKSGFDGTCVCLRRESCYL